MDRETKLMCLNLRCRVELFEAGNDVEAECPACWTKGEIDS